MDNQSIYERRLEEIKDIYVLWKNMHLTGNGAMLMVSEVLKREYRVALDVELYVDGHRISELVSVEFSYDKE